MNNDNNSLESIDQDNLTEANQTNNLNEVGMGLEDRVQVKILEKEMQSSYLKYAMSVIVSRALPDARDGMKPVHRRIIYTMHKLGLTPGSKFMKSARIVGEALGRYHPHGDLSVYNAMVRMAQEFSLRYPLVDGQGNFGSVDGDSPAAFRYTEARLNKPSAFLIQDIDKDTVDFVDNYDGSTQEPTVLPNLLPNLLLNGSTGIAVGMATNIPPHNAQELIAGIKMIIDNEDTTIDELLTVIKGPDFPTAAIAICGESMIAAYKTGYGKVSIKSRAEISDNRIIIHEIPYEVNKAECLIKIAESIKDKKLEGIRDVRDESNKDGIRIVFELKREASPEIVLNNLYKQTDLQKNFNYNTLALVNRGRQPKLLNLKDCLVEFITHRKEVVIRRTKFDLKNAKAELHILEGLKIALDFIDEVVALIRSSKDKPDASVKIQTRFELSEKQAEAILMMRLQTLTGMDKNKILASIEALLKLIASLELVLSDNEVFKALIHDELDQLSLKLPQGRRTEIVNSDTTDFSNEDLIPNDQMYLQFTKEQYFKLSDLSEFKSQGRGGKGAVSFNAKDSDSVVYSNTCNMHDYIYIFTNFGRVYQSRVYQMPQGSRVGRGQNLVNYFSFQKDEKVTTIFTISKEDMLLEDANLIFALTNGKVKKTNLNEYKSVYSNGKVAIKLNEGEELLTVSLSTSENDNIMLVASNGRSTTFNITKLNANGRVSMGKKGINITSKDKLIAMQISRFEFQEEDGSDELVETVENKFPALLTISEKGFGKMSCLSLYRLSNRGGKGVLTFKKSAKSGSLIFAQLVYGNEEEILITTRKGVSIKTPFTEVASLGRNSTGKTLMKTNDTDLISTASVFKKD